MIKQLYSFIPIVILFSSCNSEITSTFWINSTKVECDAGAGKMQCLQIYKGENLEDASWENFYTNIEGFEFKSGTFQKIEVLESQLDTKNIPADASSIKYSLIQVIETQNDARFELNGSWELIEMQGESIDSVNVKPNLVFDIAQMRASGSDGCNILNGSIASLTNSSIEFGNFMNSLRACPEEIMTLAENYKKTLSKVSTYSVENNTLILSNSIEEKILIYSRGE